MKIAFDAKRAFHNTSGLGNYSRHVMSALGKNYPDQEYFLYTPAPRLSYSFQQEAPKASCSIISPTSFPYTLLPGLWRSSAIASDAAQRGVQLYHGLSNELTSGLAAKKIKSVVTIHDLIFLRYPELYPAIDRMIYKRKFASACERADAIIAVSKQTAEDIEEFLHIPSSRIVLVGQDCHPAYHQLVGENEKTRVTNAYSLPKRYLLSVGTIEKRKNQLNLLKAAALLNDSDLHIVLVGGTTAYQKEIDQYLETSPLKNRVKILQRVPVEDLRVIYQLAQVFVYPSLFEGFGIPILEGLNSGVPVVTSTGSCFSETGGEAALYADPLRAETIAEQLKKVLTSEEVRSDMVQKGLKHALTFREDVIAEKIMNVYKSLVPQK